MPVPQPPSAIWGALIPGASSPFAVDAPVVQDATYRFTNVDRNYIDSQARGAETHLVQSLIGGTVCTWAILDPGSAAAVVGNAVCLAGSLAGTVTLATAAALLTAGKAFGIAMTAASPGGAIRIAKLGYVPPSITGLPTSGNNLYARVNTSNATVQTVSSFGSSDYVLGAVDAAGNLDLLPQFPTQQGAGQPAVTILRVTGPGSVNVTEPNTIVFCDPTSGPCSVYLPNSSPADGFGPVYVKDTTKTSSSAKPINIIASASGNRVEDPQGGPYEFSVQSIQPGASLVYFFDESESHWDDLS